MCIFYVFRYLVDVQSRCNGYLYDINIFLLSKKYSWPRNNNMFGPMDEKTLCAWERESRNSNPVIETEHWTAPWKGGAERAGTGKSRFDFSVQHHKRHHGRRWYWGCCWSAAMAWRVATVVAYERWLAWPVAVSVRLLGAALTMDGRTSGGVQDRSSG